MGIIENLNEIKNIKEQIKLSISEKGIDMADVPFVDYPDRIRDIQAGSNKLIVKDWGVKFSEYPFTEIPEWVDFTGTEDYSSMFKKCESLIDATGIYWNSAIYTQEMFLGCLNLDLTTLGRYDIRDGYILDLPNVVQSYAMFSNVYYMYDGEVTINLPNTNETSQMFKNFQSKKQWGGIYLTVNVPKVKFASNMFAESMFESLFINMGDVENAGTMFYNCRYDFTNEPDGGQIWLSAGKIKKAYGMFRNTMMNELHINADWSEADIDTTTFNCYCKVFDSSLRGLKDTNIDLSTIENLDADRIINSIGQNTNQWSIYFNSNLIDKISDESLQLALSKKWNISFL